MSNLDDSRKLFQDLIAPERRAVIARIDSLEKRDNFKAVNQRVETLERHTGEHYGDLGKRLDADHARTLLAINQLSNDYGLAKRVTAIEERASLPEPRADQ